MNSIKSSSFIFNIKIVLFFAAAVSAANIFPQSSLNPDSLITGVSYKFVLYNDTEVIGKVISADSLYILVSAEQGSYRLKKEDVFFISRELVSSKYQVILSLGGGIGIINAFEDHQYGGYDYKPKFSLQASGLIPLGENKGVRIDFGYTRWKKDEIIEPSYSGNGYFKTGAISKDYYYFKGDFVFGSISPVNKFWIYGIAGFGLHVMKEGAYEYEHNYYDTWGSTYHYYHNSYPGNSVTSAVISIGGAFGYRINKKLGVYADIQLNTLTYPGFYFFFGGGGINYIPIRAGITYTVF